MKNLLTFTFILIFGTTCYSQKQELPNTLSGEFGINQHGTGDILGYTYGFKFSKPLNRTFDLIIGFEGNLNDVKASSFIWEDPNGNLYDSTPHDVIAGFQLSAGIGLNIINSRKNKLGINPSIFGRYQADSMFSTTVTDYPILTGYPVPIRTYIREEPGNTTTAGGSFRLYYNYKISSNYFLGFNPGFQADLNGDTMLFATLSFGFNL
jgi:hypothetical protein